jgi:RHS repeat-associated protein
MARASADGTSTDYMTFAGLSVTDLDHNGNPTDYIYTGGQKIAMISPADHRIHLTGITSQSGEELEVNWAVPSSFIAHTGDQVCWQQYNSNGGVGGLNLRFTDGQTAWRELANDGQQMNQNNTQGIWQSRCATFDNHANATLLNVSVLKDVNTPASSTRWDLLVSDVSITRLDGTIVQLFASGKSPGLSIQTADPNYDTGFTAQAEDVLASQDGVVSATNSLAHRTHFFVGDHLGTAQMEFAQGGYPVWQGQFAPFGDELDSQATANHYKFTGKERDSESGLDYFGARYYGSSIGRWMSPDWSAGPSAIPYASLATPQSLNLYSYVGNNPMGAVDVDGHSFDPAPEGSDPETARFFRDSVARSPAAQGPQEGGSHSGGSAIGGGPSGKLADGESRYESLITTGYDTFLQMQHHEHSVVLTGDVLHDQLVAVAISYGEAEGLAKEGPAELYIDRAIARLEAAGPVDAGSPEGGHFNFRENVLEEKGFHQSCVLMGRCGIFNSNHHHGGLVHNDTANAFFFPTGTYLHVKRDVYGGHHDPGLMSGMEPLP